MSDNILFQTRSRTSNKIIKSNHNRTIRRRKIWKGQRPSGELVKYFNKKQMWFKREFILALK